MKKTNDQAVRVSTVGIAGNALLCAFKLAAGLIASSGAMVSDAIHSASDVFATVIAMIGVKVAGKSADADHPYGHDRFECVASFILAGILFVTGGAIGLSGVKSIIGAFRGTSTPAVPGILALIAAAVSIVVKELMYHYTMRTAKKLNSVVLRASAWHHRSDALSSVGSFAGILGARLGLPVLDPIASVIICLFIIKDSVDIFLESVNKTVDRACDGNTEDTIRNAALSQDGVVRIDLLRTRMFGAGIYVDLEIAADDALSLIAAHNIAERVHDAVEKCVPNVRHCMVHVNPESAGATR